MTTRSTIRVGPCCTTLFLLLTVTQGYVHQRTGLISASAAVASQPERPPEIFAPGIISGPANDGSPTFTPDSNTLFFARSGSSWSVILESQRVGDSWSTPQIAPFSGEWSDSHPVLAPDGSYLVFVSRRPIPNQEAGTRASHLWRIDLPAGKPGKLMLLPETVNISPRIFRPSVAADGTLYFMAMRTAKSFGYFARHTQTARISRRSRCLSAMGMSATWIRTLHPTAPS